MHGAIDQMIPGLGNIDFIDLIDCINEFVASSTVSRAAAVVVSSFGSLR